MTKMRESFRTDLLTGRRCRQVDFELFGHLKTFFINFNGIRLQEQQFPLCFDCLDETAWVY